jgi:hypothetical protein
MGQQEKRVTNYVLNFKPWTYVYANQGYEVPT